MVNIHQYWVYIMSNKSRTVLYIGITNDLYRRYLEHKQEIIKGFTQKYKCHDLLYYEEFADVYEAIAREKHLKGWLRSCWSVAKHLNHRAKEFLRHTQDGRELNVIKTFYELYLLL